MIYAQWLRKYVLFATFVRYKTYAKYVASTQIFIMTKYIRILLLSAAVLLSITAKAQSEEEPYFQLPIIPDSLTTLQQRTDYIVEHYWDFCDLKKAFSSKPKMAESFNTFLSFMPYASAEMAYASVDRFLKTLEKQPQDLLFIAREAENILFCDTAEMISEDLYLPFARAAANNKKIDKASRTRFLKQAELLEKNRAGLPAPDFAYTDRTGAERHFKNDTAQVVVLMISDPECEECKMARLRLDADINATKLIKSGILKIVYITPHAPTPEWTESVKNYPDSWTIGASDTFDDSYNFFTTPSFYLINGRHIIRVKNAGIDYVLEIMNRLMH